jgi:multicomponent Na+:H+ antiporter subunit D
MSVHAPILAIAVPLLGGFAVPLLARIHKKVRDLWVLLVVLFVAACAGYVAAHVLEQGIWVYVLGARNPQETLAPGGFPIRIMLTVDAMSAFMGIITGLLALMAFPFALKYIPEEEGKNLSLTLGCSPSCRDNGHVLHRRPLQLLCVFGGHKHCGLRDHRF